MIRILHIAQAAGGVERYLYTLLKRLDNSKYENTLVCSQDYDVRKFQPIVSKVECIEMYREISFIKELKVICKLRSLIKQYNPDIVYMHSSKAGAAGRIANVGLHNVSIYNAHGWAFNMKCSNKKKKVYSFIERLLAPFCTQIVAISDFEKESAIELGICKKDKIQVIFNGIDFDEYHSIRTGQSEAYELVPEGDFVVGCVGRLTKQKAPDIFIRAARKIKDKIPNAYFIMVGDGEQREEIGQLICELGLTDCVKITGWVDNPLEYVAHMDVATLLSRWEGFGLVLPEYMILEKPVVATRADAIPNVISNYKDGLLVDIDDYNAVARAVVLIHDDSKLATILSKNGLKKVNERFNVDRVALEHEQLFARLL